MDILSVVAFISLFALFLLYPKYAFTIKLLTHYARLISGKSKRPSGKHKVLCAIPFLNNCYIHRVMGQKVNAIIDKAIGISFSVIFIITTAEQLFLEINPWIILVSWITLIAVYALAWINDAILAFKMAVLLERGHMAIFCVLPPLCFFLLVSGIAPYFRKNKDELAGTFDTQYL